jgi:cytochrome c
VGEKGLGAGGRGREEASREKVLDKTLPTVYDSDQTDTAGGKKMKSVNLRDRIMNSPSTPFWVSDLIPVLEDKDPVDVLTYLNVLKTLWSEKVRELAERDVSLA